MGQEDFEERLNAVEQHVRDIDERVRANAQDGAAARILAGGANRDVGEFGVELRATRADVRATRADVREVKAEVTDFRRATTASFNALREDFTDLGRRVDQRFEAVDQRFEAVDRGFMEVRCKLDAAAAGQQQIVGLLQTIIDDSPRS